jgi:hypothetical protein
LLDPGRRKGKRAPGPPVQLDVRVRAGPSPFVVDPPWLPALSLGADYRVRGTSARPELDGELVGRTIYSSIAVWLYELAR